MATVFLIPSLLHPEGLESIPASVLKAVQACEVFFVENERTARRYFKQLWKEMVIDNYSWHVMDDQSGTHDRFRSYLKEGKTIGIVSEAGCPGVADPGQAFIEIAHQMKAYIRPLPGPNAILLALMASGMNGQFFQFVGYLPIDNQQRIRSIKELETESSKKNCTQIFIETPYRNNQLLEALLKNCSPATRICVAVNLTGTNEWISSRPVKDWKENIPDLHKQPAIFLLLA